MRAKRFLANHFAHVRSKGARSNSNSLLGDNFDRAVIVTVTVVGMVQVTIDEIIHMVAVRHGLVPATRSMLMNGVVAAAIVIGRAAVRVFRTDFEDMFLNRHRARGNRMVKVPVMKVIDMTRMFDGSVAAVLAMLVTVVRMGAGAHKIGWLVNAKYSEFFRRELAGNRPILGPAQECQPPLTRRRSGGVYSGLLAGVKHRGRADYSDNSFVRMKRLLPDL